MTPIPAAAMPVVGWPYAVDEQGDVFRSRPVPKHGEAFNGHKIKPRLDSFGRYLIVTLKHNNKRRTVCVHRLVAEAFLGECPRGKEVNHKDGNKLNNHHSNLEYVTSSENKKHAFALGLQKPRRGEGNGRSKFKFPDIAEMKRLSRAGLNYSEIARRFQADSSHVRRIVLGIRWPAAVEAIWGKG